MSSNVSRVIIGASLLGLIAGASALSCQLVAGLDGDFTQADAGMSAADAGGDASDAGSSACVPATYPDPPGGTDDGVDVGPFVVALHNIDLGDMATTPGFDLDHICTCIDDAGPSCMGTATPSSYCDGPGGVDNATAKLIKFLQLAVGPSAIGSQAFTQKINDGRWTLLMKVEGYNGDQYDPKVDVTIYSTTGLGAPPKWDGSDTWPILDTNFDANMVPRYKATGAYVSKKTLVAALANVPMTFAGAQSTLTINVTGVVLTGTIVKIPGTYRVTNGMPLCTDQQPAYGVLKTTLCADADITVDSTLPKTAPCDALSFGMSLNADPALLGPVVMSPMPTPGCPMATDPSLDSCSM